MRGLLLALFVLLFACGEPDLEGAPVVTAVDPSCGTGTGTRVFGGVVDNDSCGSDAVAVVFVPDIGDGTPATCTGTLVAKNLVLTARHCVANIDKDVRCGVDGPPPRFAPSVDPKSIAVRFGVDAKKQLEAQVKQTILPADDVLCGADIALLVLAEEIPSSIARPLEVRLDEPAHAGEKIKAVGFGLRESGVAGIRYRDRDAFPILRTGPASKTDDGRPALAPYEIETGPAFCTGDSGGPAIEMESGRIVGVISRFLSPKSDPTVDCKNATGFFYTGIAGYAHLFERAMDKKEPSEIPQMFGAEDCSSGDACFSHLCAIDGARRYCSSACTPGGEDCPSGFTCAPMDVAITRGPNGICVQENHGKISLRTAPRARVERMQTTEGYGEGCSAGPERQRKPVDSSGTIAMAILLILLTRPWRHQAS